MVPLGFRCASLSIGVLLRLLVALRSHDDSIIIVNIVINLYMSCLLKLDSYYNSVSRVEELNIRGVSLFLEQKTHNKMNAICTNWFYYFTHYYLSWLNTVFNQQCCISQGAAYEHCWIVGVLASPSGGKHSHYTRLPPTLSPLFGKATWRCNGKVLKFMQYACTIASTFWTAQALNILFLSLIVL